MNSKRIKVPAEAVRTREEILKDAVIRKATDGVEYVWVTCWNCGGTGNYPSSMIPVGRCRKYCWEGRTADTFGKLPVSIDKYVKREQAADRKAYRAPILEAQKKEEKNSRAKDADPRIKALADRYGWNLEDMPEHVTLPANNVPMGIAHDLVTSYLNKGELSEAQWSLITDKLPSWQDDIDAKAREIAEKKAASDFVGTEGERFKNVTATLEFFKELGETQWGTKTLYVFRDENGNRLTWFSTTWIRGLNIDKLPLSVQISFTVKKHETYRDEKQTIITRAKVEF